MSDEKTETPRLSRRQWQFITQAILGRPGHGTVDFESVLSSIISAFGGPQEFATLLKKEYDNAKNGPTRRHILMMIYDVMKRCSQIQAESLYSTNDLSQEELEAVLVGVLKARFGDGDVE